MKTQKPIHIFSVGGSLIVPGHTPDAKFLKQLDFFIRACVKKGHRFVLVTGGGKTARHYQDAAREIHGITRDDLDWIGIHSTRLNAHLFRTIFRDIAHPVVIKDPSRRVRAWTKPVLVAAGWKPGWSTDYIAVRLAKQLGASRVYNLSNVDWIYTADPKKDKTARPLKEMKWLEYRKLVGDKWDPGLSVPFDPVASRLADHSNIDVVFVNGKKTKNLERAFEGKSYKGTLISH